VVDGSDQRFRWAQRVEELGAREPGVRREPYSREGAPEPEKNGDDEVEPTVRRMRVAGAEASPKEEAPADARHQRMIAAHPLMAVGCAARLVAMDLEGQRVQVEGDLRAGGPEDARANQLEERMTGPGGVTKILEVPPRGAKARNPRVSFCPGRR